MSRDHNKFHCYLKWAKFSCNSIIVSRNIANKHFFFLNEIAGPGVKQKGERLCYNHS